jgi:hypothetical protein
MEKERVDNAVGLGLVALLCGVYLLEPNKPEDAEAVKQKLAKPGRSAERLENKQNRRTSIWQ